MHFWRFNADILVDSSNTSFGKDLLNELSLQVINHRATRRPNDSSICKTWIDVIFVDSNYTCSLQIFKIPRFSSGHNLIEIEIGILLPKTSKFCMQAGRPCVRLDTFTELWLGKPVQSNTRFRWERVTHKWARHPNNVGLHGNIFPI